MNENEHTRTSRIDRRSFIKTSAAAIGAFTVLPASVVRAQSELRNKDGQVTRTGSVVPSERVNIACCGIGGRGGELVRNFSSVKQANIVALCDVDMGAKRTVPSLEKYPDVPRFQDFREMFEGIADDFDAVTVGTPDFSHFPIAILAMSMGKHVYVEKPLSRTFQESELLMKAAKKYKVATQMGNQGHCQDNYYQFKSWVEAGIIKDVREITAHMNGGRRWTGWDTSVTEFPKGQPIPDTLDWDTWLMTAQHHDYHKDFVNGQWRCWYDFGMGALGDWGAHIWDGFHEFLELGLPYEIDPIKLDGHNPLFYPQATTLGFKFPERGDMPPVSLTWYDGKSNNPRVPLGYRDMKPNPNIPVENGRFVPLDEVPAGKEIYGNGLTFIGGSHGSTLSMMPGEKANDIESKLPEYPKGTSGHAANFALACKGEEETRSPFEIAGPLSQVFCLGTLAQRLDEKLLFDRKTKQITNHEVANRLLAGPPPRKGWEEYYKLA